MAESLPLFPLGTVLLPGASLPLHIFEPRYRELMTRLVTGALPERRFGIVAIKPAVHAHTGEIEQLRDIGCSAVLEDVHRLPDGRFDIVTSGEYRFRLLDVDEGAAPYLTGTVERVPDTPVAPDVASRMPPLVTAALRAHGRYRRAASYPDTLSDVTQDTDPGLLANLLAADCLLTVADRQQVLEQTHPALRLRMVYRMLNREAGIVAALRAVPSPGSEFGSRASLN